MNEPNKTREGASSFVVRSGVSQSSDGRATLYVRVSTKEHLRRRRAMGQGRRRIARAMKAPTSTLRRRWKECQESPQELRHPETRPAGVSERAEGSA